MLQNTLLMILHKIYQHKDKYPYRVTYTFITQYLWCNFNCTRFAHIFLVVDKFYFVLLPSSGLLWWNFRWQSPGDPAQVNISSQDTHKYSAQILTSTQCDIKDALQNVPAEPLSNTDCRLCSPSGEQWGAEESLEGHTPGRSLNLKRLYRTKRAQTAEMSIPFIWIFCCILHWSRARD